MSEAGNKYILDSNVFIEAHRRYYSFDIAPSFWKFLMDNAKANKLISIDRVYTELTKGKDQLAEWIKREFSFAFIETNSDNYTVVTHEVLDSTIKKKIPIPNVCENFNINYIDTL